MVGFLFDKEFRASHLEMIKGLEHHDYNSELVIPIIENTAEERDLKGVKFDKFYIWGRFRGKLLFGGINKSV